MVWASLDSQPPIPPNHLFNHLLIQGSSRCLRFFFRCSQRFSQDFPSVCRSPPGKQLFLKPKTVWRTTEELSRCGAMAVAFRLRSRPGISDWSPEQAGKLGGWKGPNLIRFFSFFFPEKQPPTHLDGSQLSLEKPHYKSTVSITFREG